MAESLCTSTHICMHQADCPDSYCGGRWQVMQLHMHDGGHRVHGSDSLRLRIERAAEAEPKFPRWSAITGAIAGFLAACILAAACMGVQIHF